MNRSIVAVIATLIGAFANPAHAFRVIEEVENSVELELKDLTLPTSTTGKVVYRTCATCLLVTQVVNDETAYILNDTTLPLADFLVAIEEIQSGPPVGASVGVFFDLNTQRVTRVRIYVSQPR